MGHEVGEGFPAQSQFGLIIDKSTETTWLKPAKARPGRVRLGRDVEGRVEVVITDARTI
jgi:hypothetical protein